VIILTSLRDVASKAVARGCTAGETITLRIYYMPISKGVLSEIWLVMKCFTKSIYIHVGNGITAPKFALGQQMTFQVNLSFRNPCLFP
jgi:hypothetical protein